MAKSPTVVEMKMVAFMVVLPEIKQEMNGVSEVGIPVLGVVY